MDQKALKQLEQRAKEFQHAQAKLAATIVEQCSGDLERACVELRAKRPDMTREHVVLLADAGRKLLAGQKLTDAEERALLDASKIRLKRVRDLRTQ